MCSKKLSMMAMSIITVIILFSITEHLILSSLLFFISYFVLAPLYVGGWLLTWIMKPFVLALISVYRHLEDEWESYFYLLKIFSLLFFCTLLSCEYSVYCFESPSSWWFSYLMIYLCLFYLSMVLFYFLWSSDLKMSEELKGKNIFLMSAMLPLFVFVCLCFMSCYYCWSGETLWEEISTFIISYSPLILMWIFFPLISTFLGMSLEYEKVPMVLFLCFFLMFSFSLLMMMTLSSGQTSPLEFCSILLYLTAYFFIPLKLLLSSMVFLSGTICLGMSPGFQLTFVKNNSTSTEESKKSEKKKDKKDWYNFLYSFTKTVEDVISAFPYFSKNFSQLITSSKTSLIRYGEELQTRKNSSFFISMLLFKCVNLLDKNPTLIEVSDKEDLTQKHLSGWKNLCTLCFNKVKTTEGSIMAIIRLSVGISLMIKCTTEGLKIHLFLMPVFFFVAQPMLSLVEFNFLIVYTTLVLFSLFCKPSGLSVDMEWSDSLNFENKKVIESASTSITPSYARHRKTPWFVLWGILLKEFEIDVNTDLMDLMTTQYIWEKHGGSMGLSFMSEADKMKDDMMYTILSIYSDHFTYKKDISNKMKNKEAQEEP